MPISDKTRKILWGRSGNRCAVCRRELIIEPTGSDDESVVGDECHVVSGKAQGPRYDPTFPLDRIDELDNLILLCRVHHKMIDDQAETYTRELLQTLRSNHEKWVSSTLSDDKHTKQPRLRRIKDNIPSHLARLTSGREVIGVIANAHAFAFDHDELNSDAEVDLVGGFLQVCQAWGDVLSDEAGDRVKVAYDLTKMLQELEVAGFWVFGAREIQRLEGGIHAPSVWPVAILKVLRASNPEIISVDLGVEQSQNGTASSLSENSSAGASDG